MELDSDSQYGIIFTWELLLGNQWTQLLWGKKTAMKEWVNSTKYLWYLLVSPNFPVLQPLSIPWVINPSHLYAVASVSSNIKFFRSQLGPDLNCLTLVKVLNLYRCVPIFSSVKYENKYYLLWIVVRMPWADTHKNYRK